MRFDVVTLFPELFQPFLAISMVGRACSSGALEVRLRSPRDFGVGPHRNVDDTPYGGGPGMVMRVDCLVACMESLDADSPPAAAGSDPARGYRILLSPQGEPLGQPRVVDLAGRPAVTLVCGRYEGVDDRVRSFVDLELSLGDFVLSGGEVAAMAVIDACARQLPGVLGNADSLAEESHSPVTGGLLEYPQYTRPVAFRGARVPAVLTSGDHRRIAGWRRDQALERTRVRRPELLRRDSAAPQDEGP